MFPGKQGKFYGTVTVGERGQVVIPAEARSVMKIEPGDKLVVFGVLDGQAVTMVKGEVMVDFMNRMSERFAQKSKKFKQMAKESR